MFFKDINNFKLNKDICFWSNIEKRFDYGFIILIKVFVWSIVVFFILMVLIVVW